MDHYQDFTYDQQKWREFPAYAEELHQQMGMKLVLIIDPAIDVTSDAFKNGLEQVIQSNIQLDEGERVAIFWGIVFASIVSWPNSLIIRIRIQNFIKQKFVLFR